MAKRWKGIYLYEKIADVNLKKNKIESWQYFKTCLKNMKKNPDECCIENNCIIGKLIRIIGGESILYDKSSIRKRVYKNSK